MIYNIYKDVKNMLTVKKITNESADKQQVMELYEESFPPVERMPFDLMLEINNQDNADLCSVYDDNEFIAFYLLITHNKVAYVSFLAVVPAKRGQNYGSMILSDIQKAYPDYSLLIDEEPVNPDSDNYEQRLARERFYIRNGFKHTSYIVTAYGVDYEILSTSDDFELDDYRNIFASIGFNVQNPNVKYSTK